MATREEIEEVLARVGAELQGMKLVVAYDRQALEQGKVVRSPGCDIGALGVKICMALGAAVQGVKLALHNEQQNPQILLETDNTLLLVTGINKSVLVLVTDTSDLLGGLRFAVRHHYSDLEKVLP